MMGSLGSWLSLIVGILLLSGGRSLRCTISRRRWTSLTLAHRVVEVYATKRSDSIVTSVLGKYNLEIPVALVKAPRSSASPSPLSRIPMDHTPPMSPSEILTSLQASGPHNFRLTNRLKPSEDPVHEWSLHVTHSEDNGRYRYTLRHRGSLPLAEVRTVTQLLADLVYFHHQHITGEHRTAHVLDASGDVVTPLECRCVDAGEPATFWISTPTPQTGEHHVLAPIPLSTLPTTNVLHTKVAAIVGTTADMASILSQRPRVTAGETIDWLGHQAAEEAFTRRVWQQQLQQQPLTQQQPRLSPSHLIVEIPPYTEHRSPWVTLARRIHREFDVDLTHVVVSSPSLSVPSLPSLEELQRQSKHLTKQLQQMHQHASVRRHDPSASLHETMARWAASLKVVEQQLAERTAAIMSSPPPANEAVQPIVTRLQPILVDDGSEGSCWLHLYLVERSPSHR